MSKLVLTKAGRPEVLPVRSSGRYSEMTLVATSARKYSTTAFPFAACSLLSNLSITASGLFRQKQNPHHELFAYSGC